MNAMRERQPAHEAASDLETSKRQQALDESGITDAWLESTIAKAEGIVEAARKAGEADGVEVRCADDDCGVAYLERSCAFGQFPTKCLKGAIGRAAWYEGVLSLRRALRTEKVETRKAAYAALVDCL